METSARHQTVKPLRANTHLSIYFSCFIFTLHRDITFHMISSPERAVHYCPILK
nr:MAG TPA: hypothetical protein [Caudoviricetes sp.]